MVERFLSQTSFVSQEDYRKNLHIRVPENFNFGYDVVDAYAAEQPGKEALLWTDDRGAEIRFTFADIKRESDRTASYFQSLGIGKGDVVMLILKRRYEFWFSILALHKLGAVVIPATHLLTKKDVVYRCNTAGIKAIVAAGERVITDHIAAAMPGKPHHRTARQRGSRGPRRVSRFPRRHRKGGSFRAPGAGERQRRRDDDVFHSGTTGEPKMVAHDFTYPLGHITTGLLWHNLHEGSLHLTIADTGWAKAAWGKLYGQWLAGACLFVYDHEKFTPADMLRKIEQYRITSLCAPPTVYRFLIREDLTKYDLSSLEYCTTAGEALNGAVYDTFLRLTGIRLMEGFGQTETTLTLATFPWMKSKPGSMGVPNPQYRIDLVTPDDRSAEDGEQGQIVIRTDGGKPLGLFKGYYLNDELTREAWHDGVYYTGDVAWRDEDGYYWFVGRADDVIKSSGYRIGPFEVESALMTHPAVVECAITGVPDEIRGQVVKATIVLAEAYRGQAGEALVRELQDHVKRITAPYKYPRVIEFVESLPKTISGKIRRKEIRSGDEGK
ncbi:MAG: AMP-binding protein [Alistipes shahii]